MAYDVPGRDQPFPGATRRQHGVTVTDSPFFLSVRGDSLNDVGQYWNGLADGATIVEPLASSAWSAGFGMLTDRFGVTWGIDVATPQTSWTASSADVVPGALPPDAGDGGPGRRA
jgi:PhnB protein